MERIGNLNLAREVILNPELSKQESRQSASKRYHIQGEPISWDKHQVEAFWRNELIKSMRDVAPDFVVDSRNQNMLSAIYNYCWGREGKLDPNKGLLLFGPIGTGKSTLLKGLQRYFGKINHYAYSFNRDDLGFRFTSAVEISLTYGKKGLDGLSDLIDASSMTNLAIDEIGKETTESKHFGNNLNVIQTILQLRYEARYKCVTHATTNLNPNTDFGRLYGDYIADRCKEMFNVIEVGGDSRR